jgi:AraC family transcriptional regulator
VAEAAEALAGNARAPGHSVVLGAGTRIARLMELLSQHAARALPPSDPEHCALVDALICALVRAEPTASGAARRDPRIARALELMAESFAEPIGVEDLARAAGMGRFTLLRAFRAQVGQSPYRFLTNLRLERAAALLRQGHASILDTALACGFGDPGRFARAFRARYGCSPRHYRGRGD